MNSLNEIINATRKALFNLDDESKAALQLVGRIQHNVFFGARDIVKIGSLSRLSYLERISARANFFVPRHAIPAVNLWDSKEDIITIETSLPQNPHRNAYFEIDVNPKVAHEEDTHEVRVVYAVDNGDFLSVLWDSNVSKTDVGKYIGDEQIMFVHDAENLTSLNSKDYFIDDNTIVIKISEPLLIAGFYSRELRACGEMKHPRGLNHELQIPASKYAGLVKIYGPERVASYGLKVEEKKAVAAKKSKTSTKK